MQKIIPFKKEVIFKTNIEEIVSISLDNQLKLEDNAIKGNFIIEGVYSDTEAHKEPFKIEIPYLNHLEDIYDTTHAKTDIDDFYYEIELNKLLVNIDVSVDNLEEKSLIETRDIEDDIETILETKQIESDSYMTYRVYIVREGDTIESIIERYQVTLESIAKYNTINNIKIGDKLIIPNEKN